MAPARSVRPAVTRRPLSAAGQRVGLSTIQGQWSPSVPLRSLLNTQKYNRRRERSACQYSKITLCQVGDRQQGAGRHHLMTSTGREPPAEHKWRCLAEVLLRVRTEEVVYCWPCQLQVEPCRISAVPDCGQLVVSNFRVVLVEAPASFCTSRPYLCGSSFGGILFCSCAQTAARHFS